jgi:hypothetical protein
MKTLEFVPKVGIGPVKLGMTREEVAGAMLNEFGEKGVSARGLDFFIENGFQVEYIEGTVSFIGTSNLFMEGYTVVHQGANLFDLDAASLRAYFAQFDDLPKEGELFPGIIVTLWDADKQYDYVGDHSREVYGQVGVGDERYLVALRKHANNGVSYE